MRIKKYALLEEHEKSGTGSLSSKLDELEQDLTAGLGADDSIMEEQAPEEEITETKASDKKEPKGVKMTSKFTRGKKEDKSELTEEELAKATGESVESTGTGKENLMGKLKAGLGAASTYLQTLKAKGKQAKNKEGTNTKGGASPKLRLDFNQIKGKYLNREYAKTFVQDKSKMALTLACVAVCMSLYNSCTGPTAYLDSRNPFIRSNMTVNQGGGFASSTSQKTDTQALPNQPNNQVALDPSLQKQEGMVIKDKQEFKRLVRESLGMLRSERNKQLMNERAIRFNLAEEAVPANRKIYGNPKARFIIQEFSDVECPYCKNFWKVPKEVAELSNGQVSVEWKNLPLPFHEPAATEAAVAAECVYKLSGNKKFWLTLDRLFEATQSNGRGSGAVIRELYDELDLNADRYISCLNEPESVKAVSADKEDAARYQIQSTPTSVILDTVTGKTRVVSGAVPKEELMAAIEALNEESQTPGN